MQRIAESELVINDRGAIYHLNSKPEEIAGNIITVGDPDRVKEVSKHFDTIEYEMKHREFITHTGYIGKRRFSVVSTGIGPDNVDIVINELDALVNVDLQERRTKPALTSLNIFRFGTSGSLQREIPVDSIVAATHALGLDNVMSFYRMENNEEEKQIIHAFKTHTQLTAGNVSPYIFMGSAALLKHFVKDCHYGITVTCPGFYGPQGRVLRLGLAYPQLTDLLSTFSFGQHRISNMEMESSAIYGLGKSLGHHCISLNAIINNRITKEFTKDGAKAVENLIIQSLNIISDANI